MPPPALSSPTFNTASSVLWAALSAWDGRRPISTSSPKSRRQLKPILRDFPSCTFTTLRTAFPSAFVTRTPPCPSRTTLIVGESTTLVTLKATGPSTITVALAPASYSPPQSKQATVVGTSSALDLAALSPTQWVAQGATIAVPLTVQALNLGVPLANVTVNFTLTGGTATLSAKSAITNGSGLATVNAQLTNLNATVHVSACVAPNNSPCQTFTVFSTASSLWTLEAISGTSQAVTQGQTFQPLVLRITDGSTSANPVMGVNVTFATTLARISADGPIILGSSQAQVVTAQDGTASIVPSAIIPPAGNVGPCTIFIAVSAGQTTAQFQLESVAAMPSHSPGHNQNRHSPWPSNPSFIAQSQSSLAQSPTLLFALPELTDMTGPLDTSAAETVEATQDSNQNQDKQEDAPKDQ